MGGLFHCGEQVAFEGEFFAGVCEFAVFYEEAVFGAVGEGGDFGVEQADVVLGEDFGEVGEQVGAVGGDDLDGVAVGFFFGLDADAGGERQQAGAAAGLGFVWGEGGNVAVDKLGKLGLQGGLQVVQFFAAVVGRGGEDEVVQNKIVGGDEGAGGDDVKLVLPE